MYFARISGRSGGLGFRTSAFTICAVPAPHYSWRKAWIYVRSWRRWGTARSASR